MSFRGLSLAYLLILPLIVQSKILRLRECGKFDAEFSVKTVNHVLEGQILQVHEQVTLEQCVISCIVHEQCVSFNTEEKLVGTCHLLGISSKAEFLIPRHLWSHYETPKRHWKELGPVCQQLSPCMNGKCVDTCKQLGYRCICHDGWTGKQCHISLPGVLPSHPGVSCKQIQEAFGNVEASTGLYWIHSDSPHLVQVYCDMSTDGGGWMQVAQLDTRNGNVPSLEDKAVDRISMLQHDTTVFALSTSGLASLRHLTNFTQIRIYCLKTSVGRTLHIMTKENTEGRDVVDYMTYRGIASGERPLACKSFDRLPDDVSKLGSDCRNWSDRKWGTYGQNLNMLLYHEPAFVPRYFHINTGTLENRFECDDGDPSKEGLWQFFVR